MPDDKIRADNDDDNTNIVGAYDDIDTFEKRPFSILYYGRRVIKLYRVRAHVKQVVPGQAGRARSASSDVFFLFLHIILMVRGQTGVSFSPIIVVAARLLRDNMIYVYYVFENTGRRRFSTLPTTSTCVPTRVTKQRKRISTHPRYRARVIRTYVYVNVV